MSFLLNKRKDEGDTIKYLLAGIIRLDVGYSYSLAQLSLNVIVRLNTKLSAVESSSTLK